MEYKMIKKRMKQGKIAGAKKGMWTNGKPPYPYVYNPAAKQIEVNEDKKKIYRMIVEKYLSGIACQKIAIWLNNSKISLPYGPTRNKKGWSSLSILRLLTNETHLGYMTYGKTRKTRGVIQFLEKEDWIKVTGTHEVLKTPEEHEQILLRVAQNNIIPKKCRSAVLPLSGLLYCSKCGRRMQFKRHPGKTDEYWTAVCVYQYPDGRKCNQTGRKMDEHFYNVLYEKIVKIDDETLKLIEDSDAKYKEISMLLEMKQKELKQIDQAIEKLFDLYEEGVIIKQRFADRISQNEKTKKEIVGEVDLYKRELMMREQTLTVEMIRQRVDEFKVMWRESSTAEEQNLAYRMLVDRIVYDREGTGVSLEVLYK
ncbi:MAG TPA: recombinase family protein [Desulfosporosinus sp.]|nr:recombinase family protein [Desulfosporosinus sp.]